LSPDAFARLKICQKYVSLPQASYLDLEATSRRGMRRGGEEREMKGKDRRERRGGKGRE